MPKLSDLVPFLAEILVLPESSIGVIARHARAAGAISSGGRGPGGAEMAVEDCTNLLLAIMRCRIGGQAKEAGNYISIFRESGAMSYDISKELEESLNVKKDVSFASLTDHIISYFIESGFTVHTAPKLSLSVTDEYASINFFDLGRAVFYVDDGNDPEGDLYVEARISHWTFVALGQFIIRSMK